MSFLGAACIALAMCVATGASSPAEEKTQEKKKPFRAARIPTSGIVDPVLLSSIERRTKEAVDDGATLLIFEIDSYGGRLDSALDLSTHIDNLSQSGIHTVAYIPRRAYSAAALAAISCKDIYMKRGASLGDCAPILPAPGKLEGVEREKAESPLRSRFEDLATRNNYPVGLSKSMVTWTITIIEARNKKTGEVRYIEAEELFGLGPDWEKSKTVVGSRELLTMDADKAYKYGFARQIIADVEDLRQFFDIEGEIETYEFTLSEDAVTLLNNMYFKSLLMLIGMIGIYMEMSTPGFGVPGAIALVAFGILFGVSFLAGDPGYLAPVLFAVGLVLLGVEVLVTPGFGVLGISGMILLLASFILALQGFEGLPKTQFEWGLLQRGLGALAVVMVVFFVAAGLLARFLPSVPVLGRIVLRPSAGSDGSSRGAAETIAGIIEVGEQGKAITTLRPAGKAQFGQKIIAVVTEGEFLDAGTQVRVVTVRGNRIVVKPVDNPHAEA